MEVNLVSVVDELSRTQALGILLLQDLLPVSSTRRKSSTDLSWETDALRVRIYSGVYGIGIRCEVAGEVEKDIADVIKKEEEISDASVFQRTYIGRSWTISNQCRSSRKMLRSAQAEFVLAEITHLLPGFLMDLRLKTPTRELS